MSLLYFCFCFVQDVMRGGRVVFDRFVGLNSSWTGQRTGNPFVLIRISLFEIESHLFHVTTFCPFWNLSQYRRGEIEMVNIVSGIFRKRS